jgi:hypothetical protein
MLRITPHSIHPTRDITTSGASRRLMPDGECCHFDEKDE